MEEFRGYSTFGLDGTFKEIKDHGTLEVPVAVYEEIHTRPQPEHIYFHWHDEVEILLVEEGRGLCQLNTQHFEIAEGDIILFPPGLLHGVLSVAGYGFGFLACVFNSNFLVPKSYPIFQKYYRPLFENAVSTPPVLHPDHPLYARALEKYQNIRHLLEEKPEAYDLDLQMEMLQLWKILYQSLPGGPHGVPQPQKLALAGRNKEIMDYVIAHYTENLTIEDLEKEFNASASTINRIIKKTTGMSLTEFINRYRIYHSLDLLKNTDLSMAQIASACGFSYPSYYNRIFLRYMSITPSQYRKNEQKVKKSPVSALGNGKH